ncbi:imine reductase family protein [Streptomyces sp. NPDC001858]
MIEESEAVGVNAELPRLFESMADRAIAAGHGGEQYPVLIEEFGKPRHDRPIPTPGPQTAVKPV